MFQKLEAVEKRFEELNQKISDPEVIAQNVEWQKLMKEHANLIDVVENGANLGAFKKIWRKYNKKGLLPDYDLSAKAPLNNIKTLKWGFIKTGAETLKENASANLVSFTSD